MQLGLQLDLEVDVLAAPPCGGGGSQIMIRYSIATVLRAAVFKLLAVEDSRLAGLGRLRTRDVDYSASVLESEKTRICDWDSFKLKSMCSQLTRTTRPSPSSFSDVRLGLQLDSEVDVLAGPPLRGGRLADNDSLFDCDWIEGCFASS